ncbi:MAG: TetR/AcrR family transcriptional regulator [Paraburkholderia sp.]
MNETIGMTSLQIRKVEHLTLRSVATRAKLVAIAERLFAERGIEGVSLSDINKKAGQRNKNATHYHFGSKDGLLQAILDKHVPGIAARRNALLDDLEARGEPTLRDVVRALVYPVAEKLLDPDGGKEFVRLDAQLVATHTLSIQNLRTSSFKLSQVDRLTRALLGVIKNLPEPVAQQRLMLAAVVLFHGLADHSRMLDVSEMKSLAMHTELLVRNLEDCLVALLGGPVSPGTAELLSQLGGESDVPRRKPKSGSRKAADGNTVHSRTAEVRPPGSKGP